MVLNFFEGLKNKIKRRKVADAIRGIRRGEQTGKILESGGYITNREGYELEQGLLGCFWTFSKYLPELSSQKVLDIGSGTTKAIAQLKKSFSKWCSHHAPEIRDKISFEATVLTYKDEIKTNLGLENTHITGAETLKGIPDNSFGCVTLHYSAGYSVAPEMVSKEVDRVLVPGGVIKGKFVRYNAHHILGTLKTEMPGQYSGRTFMQLFRKLGYDCVCVDNEDSMASYVIFVKPGGPVKGVDARDILVQDFLTVGESSNYRIDPGREEGFYYLESNIFSKS